MKVHKEVERAIRLHGGVPIRWYNKKKHGMVTIRTKHGVYIEYLYTTSKKKEGMIGAFTETFMKKINRSV